MKNALETKEVLLPVVATRWTFDFDDCRRDRGDGTVAYEIPSNVREFFAGKGYRISLDASPEVASGKTPKHYPDFQAVIFEPDNAYGSADSYGSGGRTFRLNHGQSFIFPMAIESYVA